MSILLDAVTRAKQQEVNMDPILAPRADSYANKKASSLNRKVIILTMIILLSVMLAWFMSRLFLNEPSLSKVQSSRLLVSDSQKVTDEVKPSQRITEASVENAPLLSGVQFVGKVALPVPQALPNVEPEPVMWVSDKTGHIIPLETAAEKKLTSKKVASREENENVQSRASHLDAKPIMLGANMNQKGQDVLAALKKEVAIAASAVGMEEKPAAAKVDKIPLSSETLAASKHHNGVDQVNSGSEDNALLVDALQKALREVERDNNTQQKDGEPQTEAKTHAEAIPKYGQLPASVQLQVPEFSIDGHVYASSVDKRWLNVDGVELQQGGVIQGKLKVIEIRPQDVVLEISGNKFSVPAA
ncbi:general secretion pathway protein GspB [Shewanella surugensis]|uniref:General secretion pathway protein GspB n=1 Tax=Shewanella surugensis TaxID=212020 RepID=A0ABT0L713_9GAMM|nr:general secretion pathway protein GspB [Shewanella surugensis]MCL1123147.1 general secretion pathway protein GspB [Shewanella surugensis]